MNLTKEIEKLSRNYGVDYFGIADLKLAKDFIADQGGEIVSEYPFSITLGIKLQNSIVDQLPKKNTDNGIAVNYYFHGYQVINQRLDFVSSLIGSFIGNKGFKALPIPAAERIDNERICASFSHKLGANLAGLGWIGKSCLLVTPDHGPRVRFTTILSDAPLKPKNKILENRCGECNECVKICPANAFSGKAFAQNEPREERYDARKCEKFFDKMKEKGEKPVCGLCLFACPFGRK